MTKDEYNKYLLVLKKYKSVTSSLNQFYKNDNDHKNIYQAIDTVTGLECIVELENKILKVYNLH